MPGVPALRGLIAQDRHRADKVAHAMPGAEGADEDDDEAAVAREGEFHAWRRLRARAEARGVDAPLGLVNLLRRNPVRQDRAGRHDEPIGHAALPVAPPPERLDEERAIEALFRRAGIIDDRRVHLEHVPAGSAAAIRRRSCDSAR